MASDRDTSSLEVDRRVMTLLLGLLLLLLLLLMMMIRHPSGKTMRAKADWTNGRILRSHVDVWGVTDVTGHAENATMDPIGGRNPTSLLVFLMLRVKGEWVVYR